MEFGRSLIAIGDYLFLPGAGKITLLLAALGAGATLIMRRREVFLLATLPFALHILLTLGRVYPLGASRHCFDLFAPASLALGAAMQCAFNAGGQWLLPWRRLRQGERAQSAAGFLLSTILAGAAFFHLFSQGSNWRARVEDEFTLKRADFEAVTDALWTHVRPHDLVAMDFQTFVYFLPPDREPIITPLADRVWDFRLERGPQACAGLISLDWKLKSAAQVRDLMQPAAMFYDYRGDRRVWMIQIGETTPSLFLEDPWLRPELSYSMVRETALLAGYEGRILYQQEEKGVMP
jgi:hypothetical protein